MYYYRGGYRLGAGGKSSWSHGKTKVIRVPEALAEKLLEIARALDTGVSLTKVTESKMVDLSGISIRAFRDGLGVYLADLLVAGYEIRPEKLAQTAKARASRARIERVQSIKQEIDGAIEQLNLLED